MRLAQFPLEKLIGLGPQSMMRFHDFNKTADWKILSQNENQLNFNIFSEKIKRFQETRKVLTKNIAKSQSL